MRLELTAFRLWDWCAVYCATEAWWRKKTKERKTISKRNYTVTIGVEIPNSCHFSTQDTVTLDVITLNEKKNSQQITPGNWNVLLRQVRHTNNSQMNFVTVGVCNNFSWKLKFQAKFFFRGFLFGKIWLLCLRVVYLVTQQTAFKLLFYLFYQEF